jgi:hypothetical protein
MEIFLEERGIDTKKYLTAARQLGKSHGYDPTAIQFSEVAPYKLQIESPAGKLVRFGRMPYNDYIQYSHQEACGNEPEGTAERMRERFWKSHSKMAGKWKTDDYSPNWLSMRILW